VANIIHDQSSFSMYVYTVVLSPLFVNVQNHKPSGSVSRKVIC